MKPFNEILMKVIFFIAACTSVLAVALICIFLFANGVPAMGKIGLGKFLTGTMWKPSNDIFGIFPMILGSMLLQVQLLLVFRLGFARLFLWRIIARKKYMVSVRRR